MTDVPSPGADSSPHGSVTGFAALKIRDFALFFVCKLASTGANHMLATVLAYQVYEITDDPLSLAYIGLTLVIPVFVFSLYTGYIADRFDRRHVLVVCYTVMGLSSLLFALFTILEIRVMWPFYASLFLLGSGRAFYAPASSALAPNLVPIRLFANAIAWNTSASKTAQVVGPAIGGLLYYLGPDVVYILGAGVFFFGGATMAVIRVREGGARKQPPDVKALLAGLVYVFEKKIILGSLSVDLFVVLMGGVTALLPIFAKDILDVGAAGAGFLRSALAVGGLAAALALTVVHMRKRVGVIMFGTVGIFGLSIVLFALSTSFWLSMVAMFVMGFSDMVSVYIRNNLLQIATPDEMRGRVSAVNSVFVSASNELGDFRAGVFAAVMGAIPAALFGGVAAVVIAAACWKLFPDLAKVDRMDKTL